LNTDLFETNEEVKLLNNVSRTYGLNQLICEPTRVSVTRESLLDHIYVSDISRVDTSGVFTLTTSDHRFTYLTRKVIRSKCPTKLIEFRNLNNINSDEFSSLLDTVDWESEFHQKNTEQQLDCFESKIWDIIDNLAPSKMKKTRGASISWMNSDILSLIAKRDKIKEDFDKTRRPKKFKEYKKFRNFVKNRVDSAKRNHYVSKFDNNCESGKMWKLFDDLT
jgi:hypothetical protein